ncbi:MAG: YceI family protein [Hyphomicrobiaceae bacterium]|nr:MAG: YceI family protein [Hyphomicrobiaceae bacterium]
MTLPACLEAQRSASPTRFTRWPLLLAAVLAWGLAAAAARAETIALDKRNLSIGFEVEEFWLWRVEGRFSEVRGELVLDSKEPARSTLRVVARTASISTGSPRRDHRLKSADFFAVTQHPFVIFESTRIELADQNSGVVIGDLNMLGVTRPIRLKFEVSRQRQARSPRGAIMSIRASGVIRRSEWGMAALIPAISDDVHLKISANVGN